MILSEIESNSNDRVKRKNMPLDKPSSTSTRNSSIKTLAYDTHVTNCNVCDENRNNNASNSKQTLAMTAHSRKVSYRQTTLSEYFPIKQEIDVESKSGANVILDFRELLSQLLNAKVMVERLSQAVTKAKLYPTLHVKLKRLSPDERTLTSEIIEENCNMTIHSKNKTNCLRYCYKCKTTHVDGVNVSARKKCRKCATDLLYVCDKCNERPYLNIQHLRRHQKSCKAQETSNTAGQELKSLTFHRCVDCNFFTAYEQPMKLHVRRTKHRGFF